MKTRMRILAAALSGLLAVMAARAADVSGQWRAEFDTQIGLQKYLYTFQLEGEKLTGKANAEVGDQKREVELKEGKISGDTVTFVETFKFQDNEIRIDYTGKIAGSEIKFTRKVGDFATEEFVAKRVQIAADKTLIDYFLPMPVVGSLATNVWGAPGVFPRDPQNGLEDTTMKQWCYWDGQIIKGPEGKYHMFASRWDQAKGHNGWWGSLAVHAVSDKVIGPFTDQGLCWPDNQGGKGHNVTALVLPDGRYAVVVSETRPGDVFISKSLDGPWEFLGSIKVATNEFSRGGRMSNASIMVRPDGNFMIVPRSGAILISKEGILGPYTVQGPSVYPSVAGLPLRNLEDPVVWYSGGWYHIVVNGWSDRKAYHITSPDGIKIWTFRGLAYDPTKDFVRYTDGTVNHWDKMERPGVVIENGHVTFFTFAVLDVPKNQEKGNDAHGSKIIVVPFDGAAFDRDMQNPSNAARPGDAPTPRR